ncbi:MAG: protein translocase subunit SecF [Minisyncoccales bacterium]|jgi:preprotein translocase subunit SecF
MINFLKYRKLCYAISGLLIIASIFAIVTIGVNPGIEFTGGSIMEIEYQNNEKPQIEDLRATLLNLDIGEVAIQPIDDNGFVIRMSDLGQKEYEEVKSALVGATENRFESIGPTIGKELGQKALLSIVLSSLAIALYITITFSGTGGANVKSWQYGVIAAGLGFLHDVLIVLGIFVVLGKYCNVQMTIPIAVALLTVLGYSINDTVVIFDRIREIGPKNPKLRFDEVVNKSINETLGRSINTSLTTLIALFSIFFFGGETLRWFIFAMISGIILGTYSSVFLAGTLLTSWSNLKFRTQR